MNTAKAEVAEMLSILPDESSLEDIQYHLYVLEKIKNGRARAAEGTVSHKKARERLGKWLNQ